MKTNSRFVFLGEITSLVRIRAGRETSARQGTAVLNDPSTGWPRMAASHRMEGESRLASVNQEPLCVSWRDHEPSVHLCWARNKRAAQSLI